MSLLLQDNLVGWFLDSPSHKSTQTLVLTSLSTSRVYKGRSPMWCSILIDPLQGWLKFLKPSSARHSLWSAWPSVFSLPFALSIYFLCSSVILHFAGLCMPLKPLELMVVRFLLQLRQIAYYSFVWSPLSWHHHQNHKVRPLVLLQTAPACLVGSFL